MIRIACALWFVALDTVRLRKGLSGQALAIAGSIVHQAARSTGSKVLDNCIIAHGVRALVCSATPMALRRFTRRAIALLALHLGHTGARWRGHARIVAVKPDRVASLRAYLAACKAIARDDDMVKKRRNSRSALRRSIRFVQAIECANEAALGIDEIAGRIRRYVGAHEAPHDDQQAFSKLCEVIFAQGLGFDVVAKHWSALEAAFSNFVPREVASIGEEDVGKMLAEPIIRNKSKVNACIENARRWVTLASQGTYLGRLAMLASSDDAGAGWPGLTFVLQQDFQRLGEPTARLVLKRWGFFTARAHPGAQRLLARLGVLEPGADGVAVGRVLGSLAEAMGKDPYAIEAALAIFAGDGPCLDQPRCATCALSGDCNHALVANELATLHTRIK